MKPQRGEAKRFFEDSIRLETEDCIIWPFAQFENGYGSIKHEGRPHRVHRLALEARCGKSQYADSLALHLPVVCHNRLCFNYKHLTWGNQKTNVGHKLADGTTNRGERHGRSKLTEDQVKRIRRDTRVNSTIAREYKVSEDTIHSVKKLKTWGWLK